jgi:hypothetical protein
VNIIFRIIRSFCYSHDCVNAVAVSAKAAKTQATAVAGKYLIMVFSLVSLKDKKVNEIVNKQNALMIMADARKQAPRKQHEKNMHTNVRAK